MATGIQEWLSNLAQIEAGDMPALVAVVAPVAGITFAVARKLLAGGRKGDQGRRDLARLAERWAERLTALYRHVVLWMLALVDKAAGNDYLARAAAAQPAGPRLLPKPSPWSNGLYDLMLRFAVAYPLLLAVAGWALSGQAMPGLEVFLPSGIEGWRRGLLSAGLAVYLISMVLIFRSRNRPRAFMGLVVFSMVGMGAGISFAMGVGDGVIAVVALGGGVVVVTSSVASSRASIGAFTSRFTRAAKKRIQCIIIYTG